MNLSRQETRKKIKLRNRKIVHIVMKIALMNYTIIFAASALTSVTSSSLNDVAFHLLPVKANWEVEEDDLLWHEITGELEVMDVSEDEQEEDEQLHESIDEQAEELDDEQTEELDDEQAEELDEEQVEELDEERVEELDEEQVEELDDERAEDLDDERVEDLDDEQAEELDDEQAEEPDDDQVEELGDKQASTNKPTSGDVDDQLSAERSHKLEEEGVGNIVEKNESDHESGT